MYDLASWVIVSIVKFVRVREEGESKIIFKMINIQTLHVLFQQGEFVPFTFSFCGFCNTLL
jgi:hypothetical protein